MDLKEFYKIFHPIAIEYILLTADGTFLQNQSRYATPLTTITCYVLPLPRMLK
jgi:hypothetical protein